MARKCSQCRTPAVVDLGGNYLCVNCYSKAQQAHYLGHVQLASAINQIIGDMENIAGLPYGSLGQRFQIPMPTTINAGQSTFNNIRVDNSVVGTINTGYIKKLDSMLNAMKDNNDTHLAQALQTLTQAIIDTSDLKPDGKNSALECLSFLSNQSLTQKENRQSTIGRTVISTLDRMLSNTGSLASIWSATKPYLDALF